MCPVWRLQAAFGVHKVAPCLHRTVATYHNVICTKSAKGWHFEIVQNHSHFFDKIHFSVFFLFCQDLRNKGPLGRSRAQATSHSPQWRPVEVGVPVYSRKTKKQRITQQFSEVITSRCECTCALESTGESVSTSTGFCLKHHT